MDVVRDNCLSERRLSPEQTPLELGDGFVSGTGCSQPIVQKCQVVEEARMGSAEMSTRKSDHSSVENLKLQDDPTIDSDLQSLRLHNGKYSPESDNILELKQVVGDENDDDGLTETVIIAPDLTGLEECIQIPVSPCENVAKIPAFGSLGSELHDASTHLIPQQSETTQSGAFDIDGESGHDKRTPVRTRKRKYTSTLPDSGRVLRSRSQEKSQDSEPKDAVVEDGATDANRRKRKKRKKRRKIPVNEISRIRAHLRYLLHRIKYEQNLIDAYSGEGWKGQSLEKIKPEKELQRAKSQIFRYKLKIRDLFQRIDMSLAEGKLPEFLFDSDGQIDSEDIFCAKCGSKDLALENDIILCDGACERGFHQFCLEPPLLKEDIPPDEEGWLCPGCDCKVDCIDMLNDFQGSNLSVLDKWEKVFPEEAAAAASGRKMDDYSGIPSDDSEDDDYDPDKPELENTVSGDESSSNDSDYFSASDDLVTSLNEKRILQLPSDDSEDNDYDPDALDNREHAKQESSGSDFTSDSEDFGAMFHGNELLEEEERNGSSSILGQGNPNVGFIGEKFEVGGDKRHTLGEELSFLLESNDAQVSGKRRVERLDYKKLHDETYGDSSSDSSDEDYGEAASPTRRKNITGKAIQLSSNEPQRMNNGADVNDEKRNQTECDSAAKGKIHRNFEVGSSNNMFAESPRISTEVGSSGKSTGRSYKRLGEGVIQRLLQSFRENQYPKQDVKESLAKELGLRIQQVSKWFENARWSSRHSSRMESKIAGSGHSNGTSSPQIVNDKVTELGQKSNLSSACNGKEKMALFQASPPREEPCNPSIGEGKSVLDSSQDSRKRNTIADHLKLDQSSSGEKTFKQDLHVDTSKSRTVRRSSRLQARSSN